MMRWVWTCSESWTLTSPRGRWIAPWSAGELANVAAEPLSIILRQSWLTGDVPADWRLADVTPIFQKGRKDDPGSYRPISLTSVLGKVMEWIISRAITDQLKVCQGIMRQ